MLVSTPARATAHDFCSSRFAAAWDFLQRADVASLPNGHHVIDGEDVYANVMEYDTAPASEKQMEAHRRYYDVHFVAAGAEELWVAPTAALPETQPTTSRTTAASTPCPPSPRACCCRRATSPSSHPRRRTCRAASRVSPPMSRRSS